MQKGHKEKTQRQIEKILKDKNIKYLVHSRQYYGYSESEMYRPHANLQSQCVAETVNVQLLRDKEKKKTLHQRILITITYAACKTLQYIPQM